MTAAPHRFPDIEARSLTGRSYRLPGDLDGERNVLLVAFHREQQREVDGWLPDLLELERGRGGVRIYEIPTISRRWSPLRRLIDGGMSHGIGDPEARARTLTTYTDVGRVLGAIGVSDTETISVLVVEPSGRILWQGAGGFERSQLEQLTEALE